MRTTVNIDDDLLRQARRRALEAGVSLGSVLEDALRLLLVQRHELPPARTVSFPMYGKGGLRRGVDLEDKEALLELLDGESVL